MTRIEAFQNCLEHGITFESTWYELDDKQKDLLCTLASKTKYRIKYDYNNCLCEDHQKSFKFYYHLQKNYHK